MAEPTREQLIDIIDQIAREWDGCEYDAPGENIDIGDAIRTAGYRRVHRLFDTSGVPAVVSPWINTNDRLPEPGQHIVKRWKNGATWAGIYSGTAKDSSFHSWFPLPPQIPEEPQCGTAATPALVCHRCKVDRYKDECGDPHSGQCPMVGTTAGVPRLDPVPTADSFDGITGRPHGVLGMGEAQGENHG